MAFRVAARTIIELGAELISSDSIALYELIKNAYDARSTRVHIDIRTVFRFSDLRDSEQRIEAARARIRRGDLDEGEALEALRRGMIGLIDGTAETELETRKNRYFEAERPDLMTPKLPGPEKGSIQTDFHDAWRRVRRFCRFAGRVSPCIPGVRGRSAW